MIDFIELNVGDVSKSRYKEFVSDTIGNQHSEEFAALDKAYKEEVEKKVAPRQRWNNVFGILGFLFVMAAMIFCILFLDEDSALYAVRTVWKILVEAGILLFGAAFFTAQILCRKSLKKIYASDRFQSLNEQARALEKQLREEMNIPEDAFQMDVFVRHAVQKGSSLVNALPRRTDYVNYEFYAFRKEEAVFFSDNYELIRLDVPEIVRVRFVDDKLSFVNWHKAVKSPRELRKYNVSLTSRNALIVRGFYSVEIRHKEQDYVLRIPGYEKESVARLFPENGAVR